MNLTPIPAFNDNYIWMLDDGRSAWVVDPGDATPVETALKARNLRLQGVLITHHHFDHVGGLEALIAAYDPAIVGPVNPAIPAIQQQVGANDSVSVLGATFTVYEVPGHTLDHIAFYSAEEQLLFCGDTLFAGGCGRIFEGDPEMMYASLSTLAALPGDTKVCCAHEYTLANLDFARAAEPQNLVLMQREADCKSLRQRDLPTVPSDIATELATNPFLRADSEGIHAVLRSNGKLTQTGPVSVFAALRGWKDVF